MDIAEALRRAKMLDAADLARCESVAGERGVPLATASIDLGMLTEDQVQSVVAEGSGLELVFPSAAGADPAVVARFPAAVLRRREALPLLCEDGEVVVAFAEAPGDDVLAELSAHAGARVRPVLAARRRLLNVLERVLGERGPAASGTRTLADHPLPAAVADWLRGPFAAPAGAPGAAHGLVLVAATEKELMQSFADAVLRECNAMFVEGDLAHAAETALSGGRVVVGVVSASPAAAALDVLDTDAVRHRLRHALAAVVLLDACRALCAHCAQPSGGASKPTGCSRCGQTGYAGTEIVAEAMLAAPWVTDRLAEAAGAQALVRDGAVSEAAAALVRAGRVAPADGIAAFGRLGAP